MFPKRDSSVREMETSLRVRDQHGDVRRTARRDQGGHLLDWPGNRPYRDNGLGPAHTNIPVRTIHSQRPACPDQDNNRDMTFFPQMLLLFFNANYQSNFFYTLFFVYYYYYFLS